MLTLWCCSVVIVMNLEVSEAMLFLKRVLVFWKEGLDVKQHRYVVPHVGLLQLDKALHLLSLNQRERNGYFAANVAVVGPIVVGL